MFLVGGVRGEMSKVWKLSPTELRMMGIEARDPIQGTAFYAVPLPPYT
jgi:hypothetical protein